jgi:hypothetical protein
MSSEIIKTFKNWPQFKKRFMANIPKKCFLPGNENICWEWQGYKHNRGYGRIKWGENCYRAHRVSYMIFKGEVLADKLIRHTCDNPSCVNPNHLLLGSQSDNMVDMANRNHQNFQKLNKESVKVIKWMLKYRPEKNLTNKLAKLHKVSAGLISTIRHGHAWGHIHV